jgi:hypothetical protein
MRGNYSSLYLRKAFTIADPQDIDELLLEMQYDDGVNLWINGVHVVGVNVPAVELAYNRTAGNAIENINFVPFTLTNPSAYLQAGENVIAVQLLNASLNGSSDAFFDARLTARSGNQPGLTPGAANSVLTANTPPPLRQVDHSPKQPASGEPVIVTIKATDSHGVASVMLEYQLVNPGDYIEQTDPRFQTNWTQLAMRVNATDLLLVRNYATHLGGSVPLISTLPEASSPLATLGNPMGKTTVSNAKPLEFLFGYESLSTTSNRTLESLSAPEPLEAESFASESAPSLLIPETVLAQPLAKKQVAPQADLLERLDTFFAEFGLSTSR